MRNYYHPESITDWELTLLQSGGSLPAYSGVAYQRGGGLGSFFRGLFRAIWPSVKKVGIVAGKEALRAGSEATRDAVTDGVEFKTALKRRGKQALGRTITGIGNRLQHGSGLGCRPTRKTIKGVKRRRKQRKTSKDIFNG